MTPSEGGPEVPGSQPVGKVSAWGALTIAAVSILLLALMGLRLFLVSDAPEQELRESRRIIHDARLELDSLKAMQNAIRDSVSGLRTTRASLTEEVVGLAEEVANLGRARSQYYSDTHARVVLDIFDKVRQRLDELEQQAGRARDYPDLIAWLDAGRRLADEFPVPEANPNADAAIARFEDLARPYTERWRHSMTLIDSLQEAGVPVMEWSQELSRGSAALDTARVFGDSAQSIRRASIERLQASGDRLEGIGEWRGSPPPAWGRLSFAIRPEDLEAAPVSPPESPLYQVRAFRESLSATTSDALTIADLLAEAAVLEPLDRLLPVDRRAVEESMQRFLTERAAFHSAGLEVRLAPGSDDAMVGSTGEAVLAHISGARAEARLSRIAMLRAAVRRD